MYSKQDTKTFTFGKISFTVENYRGLYFLSDKVKQEVAKLSKEEAKTANSEAWKQKKYATKETSLYCNASFAGNSDRYEEAAATYNIAEQVIKITYKQMMGYKI